MAYFTKRFISKTHKVQNNTGMKAIRLLKIVLIKEYIYDRIMSRNGD